jgi:predicted metal-dependent enzyme (double-stranded beta helix superfamily)
MGAPTVAGFVGELRALTAAAPDPGELLARLRPLARALALAPTWLEPRHLACDPEQGFGVHPLHEEPDHSLWVVAAAWLPGRGAPPHNHGTWALVAGVEGVETNVFWKRLDDGRRPGHARLREQGRKRFGPGEVVTLLPGAIHSVLNETDRVTVSLHVYGRHLNHTARSQFDPERELEQPFVLKVS